MLTIARTDFLLRSEALFSSLSAVRRPSPEDLRLVSQPVARSFALLVRPADFSHALLFLALFRLAFRLAPTLLVFSDTAFPIVFLPFLVVIAFVTDERN